METYKINSHFLKREVRAVVRTPLDIKSELEPNILYMHDGQNAYVDADSTFGHSWRIAVALDRLETEGKIAPTFVVAINSISENAGMERCREFSIFDNKELLKDLDDKLVQDNYPEAILKARGNEYLDFITQELIPYIEPKLCNEFKQPQRAMIGSSMGGLITHICGLKFPDLFFGLICMSNAYWYCNQELSDYIKGIKPTMKQKYYIDVGTREESMNLSDMNERYIQTNTQISQQMIENGFDVSFDIINGAEHNESAWANRLESILENVLGGS